MSTFLYFEVNLICVLTLALLLINLNRTRTSLPDEILFKHLITSTIIILAFDTVSALSNQQFFFFAREICIISNMLYFLLTGVICYLWFLYTEYKFDNNMASLKKKALLFSPPMVIQAIMSFVTPFTGWFYYVSADNTYVHGKLFFVQAVLSWFYIVYSFVRSIYHAAKEPNRSKKSEYMILALFIIFPVLASLIQSFTYGLPLLWVSVSFSLLITFINIQNNQISLDALTGLYNRGQFNKYLGNKFESLPTGDSLYMLLIDVDRFKSINDTYGHSAGDDALIKVADILKTACTSQVGHNDFVARFGGDEFAILCHRKNDEGIADLIQSIESITQRINNSEKLKYRLSLSCGIARYISGSGMEADDLISDADREMYAIKQNKDQKTVETQSMTNQH